MGLISKIEDKLSGSSSSDANKLEKSQHGSSTTGSSTSGGGVMGSGIVGSGSSGSKIQNPISSGGGSGPTGSAIDPSTGNVSSKYAQNTSSSSGAPSSYPQNTSGYTSTAGASDRMPGSYVNEEDHIPSQTTSSSRTGPSQPYDPYSSRGQETAARAGTTSSSSRYAEDPSLSRSRDGGIMNQQSDQYGSQTSPTSGTTSSHHYGRDAALAGGAGAVGAGGVGAYEMNRSNPSSQPLTSSSGQPSQYQDVSYMQQSQPGGTQDPSMSRAPDPSMSSGPGITTAGSNMPGSSSSSGATSGEAPGFTQAKKMGGAYEAGYRDAMEHMKQEMGSKGTGSGQAF